jgi:HEAT repeat protein
MSTKWSELFEAWHRALLDADEATPQTLFRAPASQEAIAALEARLEVRLPPSYRAFLEQTDGAFAFPGWGVVREGMEQRLSDGLLPVESVDWLRAYDPTMVTWLTAWEQPSPDEPSLPSTEGTWHHPAFDPPGTEREYLYPDGGGDPVNLKSGHLLYGLAISRIVDGYHTILNPLVVDADGEWEAWDAGTKLPGANRYGSFAALIEVDIARMRQYHDQAAAEAAGVEDLVKAVLDSTLAAPARLAAAWKAFGAGARTEMVRGLRQIALDTAVDLGSRQTSLQLLGYIRGREALDALIEATADPDPRFKLHPVAALAVSDDPADRDVAIAILADPQTPSFVVGSTYRPAGSVVWEAYRRSGNEALLPQLARLGEARAVEAILAILLDPARSEDEIRDLLTYAYYLRDPRIAPALAACARRYPMWRTNIGANLVSMGDLDEAIPLLVEAMRDGDGFGRAEETLAQIRDPRAAEVLRDSFRLRPTAIGARALGWHPSEEAVAILEPVLDDPALHLGAIDALELMAIPEAREALARRSAAGDGHATRALARLRDPRARDSLLRWLLDADPQVARIGADGLRDLRDPSTGRALLDAASHKDPDVAVTAVHALVAMGSPHARTGLEALAGHPDERAQALAARWLSVIDAL